MMEKFFKKERDWPGLWGLDQLHWSRVSKTKLGWNQGNIVYFQKQKWVCKFQWQGLEYKIDQLRKRGRWKKKRIRRTRWQKFGADAFRFVFEEVCVGKRGCIWRLWKWAWGILMKNCVDGFPRFARIGTWFSYKRKKGFGFGNEGSDWVAFGSEFREVKGRLPASPTSLKSTTLFLGSAIYRINSWTIISDLIGAWMWINVNWYFLIKCIANTLH